MPSIYKKKNTALRRKVGKALGATGLVLGLITLVYFFFPLISYQLFLAQALATGGIESPVPKNAQQAQSDVDSLLTQSVNSLTTDYTDARNWFPQQQPHSEATEVTRYQLSIPSLNIHQAEVATDSFDLGKNLVQYYGDNAPPEKGTAIIYGHSTLPQLFNPKDYKAIFATVHTMELGDVIQTHVNGKTYQYKVFSMNITDPEDPNIFTQSYDNSYITLVTCTPPGTIWKRLIIRASLEKEV